MEHRRCKTCVQAGRSTLGMVLPALALFVGTWVQPLDLRGEMIEQKDRIIYKSGITEQEREARKMEELSKQDLSRKMLENIIIEMPPRLKSDPHPAEHTPR